MQNGVPSTILGVPIVETVDMPLVASNAYAMAVGNFRLGYKIVDRMGTPSCATPTR